jgi:hypothetical protein
MDNKIDTVTMRKFLTYNEETGIFTWIYHQRNKCLIGTEAGSCSSSTGYISICINGRRMDAHRLAWMWVYNEIPMVIDHINGIRTDNRIANLRNGDYLQNTHNKKRHREHGRLPGTYYYTKYAKWGACHSVNRESRFLGLFATEQEAYEAYLEAVAHPENIKTMKKERALQGIPIGVEYNVAARKWRVTIYHQRKGYYCGAYSTKEEASKVADEARPIIKSGKPYDYKQQHPLTTPTV